MAITVGSMNLPTTGTDPKEATKAGLHSAVETLVAGVATQVDDAIDGVIDDAGVIHLGTIAGTANAITSAIPAGAASVTVGASTIVSFRAASTNTGTMTLKVGANTTWPLVDTDAAPLVAGAVRAGQVYQARFVSGDNKWLLMGSGMGYSETQTQINTVKTDIAPGVGEWIFANVALVSGYLFNTGTSALVVNENYQTMSVDCVAGDIFKISGSVNGVSTALAAFVNAAGTVIEEFHEGTGVDVDHEEKIVVAPLGAVALKTSQLILADVQIRVDRLSIDPFAERAPSGKAVTAASALSKWESVDLTWVDGSFISRLSGVVTVGETYRYAKGACTAQDRIRVSGDVKGTGVALIVFYDGSGDVVYSYQRGQSEAVEFENREMDVPTGAVEFGVTQLITALRPITVEVAQPVANLYEVIDGLLTFYRSLPIAFIENSNISKVDGTIVSNSAYSYAKYECEAGKTYRFSADLFGSGVALVVWYDDEGYFLDAYGVGSNSAPVEYRNVDLIAPNGAVQFGMTYRDADPYIPTAQVLDVKTTLSDYMSAYISASGIGGDWAGKTVAWFGTSIPAGGWPDLLGAALGATVYNEALASSCCRAGIRSRVAGGDIYGFQDTNWAIATLGLSGTLAEKNDIVDEWATYQPFFADAPATLTPTQEAKIIGSSYETRLVANHLGANARDIYVFDHGFNDCGSSSMADDATTGAVDSVDRLTFIGSVNYLVNLILEDNPKAEIFFIGHYDPANPNRTTLVPAQKILAAHHARPILPLYEMLGWSSAVEVETTGYWTGGVWTPSGGSAQDLTTVELWLPDGVHPHSDDSGAANARIVEVALPWFQSPIGIGSAEANSAMAVAGPVASVDGNLVAFDGTNGRLAKDSGIAIASLLTVEDTVTVSTEWSDADITDSVVTLPTPGPFDELLVSQVLDADTRILPVVAWDAGRIRFRATQDATGGHRLTWPVGMRRIGFPDAPSTAPGAFYEVEIAPGPAGTVEARWLREFVPPPIEIIGAVTLVNNALSDVTDQLMSIPGGLQDGDDLLLVQVWTYGGAGSETPSTTGLPTGFSSVYALPRAGVSPLDDASCIAVQRRTLAEIDLPLTQITIPQFRKQSSFSILAVRGLNTITAPTSVNRDLGADANAVALPVETVASDGAIALGLAWWSDRARTPSAPDWDLAYEADFASGTSLFNSHAVFTTEYTGAGSTTASTVTLSGLADMTTGAVTLVLEP